MAAVKWLRRNSPGILGDGRSCYIKPCNLHQQYRRISSSTFDVEKFKSRQIPLIYEAVEPGPSLRLEETLSGFVPSQTSGFQNPRIQELNKHRPLPISHHLCYFNAVAPDTDLLDDGTDLFHSPDSTWNHRLWTGGSIEMPLGKSIFMDGDRCALKERIKEVKSKDAGQKMFVQVERSIFKLRGQHLERYRKNSLDQHDFAQEKPHILEHRWLYFSRNSPFGSAGTSTGVEPPADPFFQIKMCPTPSLLFRFSALTFNAHAIHINPEYARNVYGLPNVVVHGPLTVVLMTRVLRLAMQKRYVLSTPSGEIRRPFVTPIEKLEYRNSAPLFANEEMTICCKPVEPLLDLENLQTRSTEDWEFETWQIWIQKKENDRMIVAASCTAKLKVARKLKPRDKDRWAQKSSTPVKTVRSSEDVTYVDLG